MSINTSFANKGSEAVPQQPSAPQSSGSVSWGAGRDSIVEHSASPHIGGAQAPATYDQIEGMPNELTDVETSLNHHGARLNSAHAHPPSTWKTKLLALLRCVMDDPSLLFPQYALIAAYHWCVSRHIEAYLQKGASGRLRERQEERIRERLGERYPLFRNRSQTPSTDVPMGENFADQPEGGLAPSAPELEPKDQPNWTHQ
jgi:hypothetical protein